MSDTTVEDKIKAHLWVGRKLTDEEWTTIRSLDKSLRFDRGDLVHGRRVSGYLRRCKDGLFLLTEEAYQAERLRRTEYKKAYVVEHRERLSAQQKVYYQRDRDSRIQAQRERYARSDKARRREVSRQWETNNPDKVKASSRRRYLNARADPHRRTMQILRRRLKMAVDAKLLYGRAQDRESVDFLLWLAVHQSIDMSTHHIDHIMPLSRCDLSTPEAQQRANAPENVRWLLAQTNLNRGNALPTAEEVAAHLVLVGLWRATAPAASATK